jgi:hypothetical protein
MEDNLYDYNPYSYNTPYLDQIVNDPSLGSNSNIGLDQSVLNTDQISNSYVTSPTDFMSQLYGGIDMSLQSFGSNQTPDFNAANASSSSFGVIPTSAYGPAQASPIAAMMGNTNTNTSPVNQLGVKPGDTPAPEKGLLDFLKDIPTEAKGALWMTAFGFLSSLANRSATTASADAAKATAKASTMNAQTNQKQVQLQEEAQNRQANALGGAAGLIKRPVAQPFKPTTLIPVNQRFGY